MIWLQEHWIIAALIAALAILVIGVLIRRRKAARFDFALDDDAPAPTTKAAPPPKPLAPIKPDIIAAEPARFKPLEKSPPIAELGVTNGASAQPAQAEAPETQAADGPAEPAAPTAPAPASPSLADVPAADNLRLLKGLGPKLSVLLGNLGVTRFDQIAAWTEADVARIDAQLGSFKGRIEREQWVDQAGYLARGDKAGFEAKYGALNGEL
ncbi:MAG TPA: hypothetical protein VFG34_00405 [Sphingopyxis sp.]|nr:hypothetical protein [Sphingopyxis sp.]